jgi:hypothetical protein
MRVAANSFLVSFIEEPRQKAVAVEDSRGQLNPEERAGAYNPVVVVSTQSDRPVFSFSEVLKRG